jgi:hypothetical protein
VIIEDTAEQDPPMLPLFYLGQWQVTQLFLTDPDVDVATFAKALPRGPGENVVLMVGTENLPERVRHLEEALGPMQLIGTAEPGFLDRVVHWLNPDHNRNVTISQYSMSGQSSAS